MYSLASDLPRRSQAARSGDGVSDTGIAMDGVTVVVNGHFNAAIFSPLWLLQQNLIGVAEFGDAQIEVITSDFASFSCKWLNCQVVPDALQFNTTDPSEFERLRDVVVGVLTALPHTPIAALGINRQTHFQARSPDHYHAIGDQLVPKQFWEELVHLPTTREVRVWGQRSDNFGGRIQIKVEPSFRFTGHVFVAYNDHFNLLVVDHQPTTREESWRTEMEQTGSLEPSAAKIAVANEILTSTWASSMKRSGEAISAIARIQ